MVCLTIAGMLKLRKFGRPTLLFVKEAGCCRLLFPSKAIISVLETDCQSPKPCCRILGKGTLEMDGREVGSKRSLLLGNHLVLFQDTQ